MYNPYSLSGKTILITGASSGIGRATAIECSRLEATVIVTGRNSETLHETFEMLKGKEHGMLIADLTNEKEVEGIIQNLPLLDGLVNNAGVSKMMPIQFYSLEDLENTFMINCFVPMLLVKQLTRTKKLKKNSSIVFTASISGYNNVSSANGIYGSSKSALSAYMKYAALELSAKGIRCNTVHPGRIETPLILNSLMTEEDKQRDIANYPLKRYGKPQEVAQAITYLLSDAASWITGSSLVIDGGRSLK